jgi:hypothetical protein
MVSNDESLPRVVMVLRRRLWSVAELHVCRRERQYEAEVTAYRRGGSTERLVTALQREPLVLAVQQPHVCARPHDDADDS